MMYNIRYEKAKNLLREVKMARESKKTPTNNTGRPTGSYSSYGTGGYGAPYGGGYGSVGNGAYGRSPYGAPSAQPVAPMNSVANNEAQNAKGDKGSKKLGKETKANKADYSNMSRKEKKLAKRQEKFDENDLRNYPMKVGGWIGTFILLAIPLIGQICAICWFFGVGNKSRAAWVRSKVVAFLLVILLIVAMFGIGYGILASKAKNVEVVFDGQSYGKLGDYGPNGTVYYLACIAIDTFGEDIIKKFLPGGESGGNDNAGEVGSGEINSGEEEGADGSNMKEVIKAMLAEKLLGIKLSNSDEGGRGDEQGAISGGEQEGEGDGEELTA